jgi:hypothetical protein
MIFKNTLSGNIFETENPNQSSDCVEISNSKEGSEYILQKAISAKVKELNIFHNSATARTLKINQHYLLSLTKEGRDLVREQIDKLQLRVSEGSITEEDAIFIYYYNGGSVSITLSQLKCLHNFMMTIVDNNFIAWRSNVNKIKALTTLKDISDYDFSEGYLINQNIDI